MLGDIPLYLRLCRLLLQLVRFVLVTRSKRFSRVVLMLVVTIVLSSMHMMLSASIGVGVMVTGAVGDGAVHFSIGDGGDGRFVISVGCAWGLGTCILKAS